MHQLIRSVLISFLFIGFVDSLAQPHDFPQAHYPHQSIINETWQWSAELHAETGENYLFYFALNRQQEGSYRVDTEIFSVLSKKKVLDYHDNVLIDDKVTSTSINWVLDKAFLNYNSVNNTWVIGLNSKDKQGFNFRIDSLKPFSKETDSINHAEGVNFYTHRAKRLNGNISINGKDTFVTSHAVWIQHFWLKQFNQGETLQNIMCHLGKQGDIYAFNITNGEHPLFGLVNRVSEKGESLPVSQFITLKQFKRTWDMKLDSPKMNWNLDSFSDYQISHPVVTMNYYAGFIKNVPGFCLLTQIQKRQFNKSTLPHQDLKASG